MFISVHTYRNKLQCSSVTVPHISIFLMSHLMVHSSLNMFGGLNSKEKLGSRRLLKIIIALLCNSAQLFYGISSIKPL